MTEYRLTDVPSQKSNCVFIAPDGKTALLELNSDHIALNFPDGSPLISANKDGTVYIRDEKIQSTNPAVYEAFQLWLKYSLHHILDFPVYPSKDQLDELNKGLTSRTHLSVL